ncbi:hypothetical protein [Curtobacterium sp. MCJR17_043]|uniref:hypothetical protein n=1 Tax=Curtobacterium sp. MCJR17_043 TaxID=2175660 RepID=UPI0024DF4EDE|nr:hypothetical protein [Curtobacterium sp. MCJR17_043]WIB36764.1 hypothetical protein DEJ15_06985 [Curtobacterium sp. MCJR17_043]
MPTDWIALQTIAAAEFGRRVAAVTDWDAATPRLGVDDPGPRRPRGRRAAVDPEAPDGVRPRAGRGRSRADR